ncbi:NADH-ubiquinone reductase complex 1 MLRQ subunit [Plasmodiophora brassicae]|uniref:Uncharacterized protein n=1 Tax=Plasmodiophora brassicae TaxID=37360 RepID=A0A0G4J1B1_PLABS|nr:hypothetical protein PBRA_001966 [Plasmodiophora brassicae]SPR01385.1 unnamed protein product [Plasmodiophora brassicae]
MVNMFTKWMSHPETWPIFGLAGGALCLGTFMLFRTATFAPDVHINREARDQIVRNNVEEGQQYFDHPLRQRLKHASKSLFGDLNERMSRPDAEAPKKKHADH